MSTFEAIILGILQGLTEFLPVSSSGHLELGQLILGFTNLDRYIFFNLVCHLGTLLALMLVFSKDIKKAFVTDKTRLFQVVLATLPLFPLVFILKPIKAIFDQPQYLGWCFLLTSLLLYLGTRVKAVPKAERKEHRWRDPLVIGLFQAVAILPGISRSGATLSAGRLLGWNREEALTFSFLLAIPAILGGVTLEVFQLFREQVSITQLVGMDWRQYIAGFSTSFVVGYFALLLLMRLAVKDKFIYFVWYCLFLGTATILYFH